ncbi:AAA family ATPase [Aquihabitans daechungensis]|uniref:AAA family ATPase n=1 Tax=Aquihabitans daechungensis TaxID=1052257 RepID=UPI003BA0C3E0
MTDQPMGAQNPALAAERLEQTLFEVKKVIVGQDRTVERLLICLLSRGHALLEGVPGLAKTLAAETIARVVGGSFTRIQFTPDLLPADVMGTRIYRSGSESFDVELGPVFANFVLADEINRAPAKVQSALLEVMAEHQVSIGGNTYPVPQPFLVLATQNPIEQEGVYPLPEAQRDRFLMKIVVDYPTPSEEVEIVQRMGVKPPEPKESLSIDALAVLQDEADKIFVAREVVDYAVNLVFATREPERFGMADLREFLQYGASPRASLGLIAAGRSLALLRGRAYVLPQDVYDVAPDIFRHRLVLSYEALARDITVNDVLARILATVPAPRVAPSQDPSATAPPSRLAAPRDVSQQQPVAPAPHTSWGQAVAAPAPPAASGPSAWDAASAATEPARMPAPWVPPASDPAAQPADPGQPSSTENPSSGWGAPGEAR